MYNKLEFLYVHIFRIGNFGKLQALGGVELLAVLFFSPGCFILYTEECFRYKVLVVKELRVKYKRLAETVSGRYVLNKTPQ